MRRNSSAQNSKPAGAGVALLLLLLIGWTPGSVASPAPVGRETITGHSTGGNGFAWRYGYDIAFTGEEVLVEVAIQLIPASGVSRADLSRVMAPWKKAIEAVWSGRFALTTPEGARYPIAVRASFAGPRFHHQVVVRPGNSRTDALHWNIQDGPQAVAHEFGHLLGVFDEYPRGATAPGQEVLDPTSIMTSNPAAGVTQARHYQEILSWFTRRTALRDVSLSIVTRNNKKEERS